ASFFSRSLHDALPIWVVCDRYTDATYAYQGGGRQLGAERVATLEQWLRPALQPDRTWLFDVPLELARARLADARQPDRFEREERSEEHTSELQSRENL